MNDIMEVVKSHEETNLLVKRVSETTQNEAKVTKSSIFQYVIWYIRC